MRSRSLSLFLRPPLCLSVLILFVEDVEGLIVTIELKGSWDWMCNQYSSYESIPMIFLRIQSDLNEPENGKLLYCIQSLKKKNLSLLSESHYKEAIDDGDDEKWWLAVEWTASQIGLAYTSIVYFESTGFTGIDDLMELTFCIKENEECQDLYQRMTNGLLKKPTILELEQKTKTLHEDRMKWRLH
ncbi:hypothetical protein P8452_65744 [Trifolium repens]|nr:hypothetical protein P8452_65744 [Trifolium repens]